jgi:hypothetical protein
MTSLLPTEVTSTVKPLERIDHVILREDIRTLLDSIIFQPPVIVIDGDRRVKKLESTYRQLDLRVPDRTHSTKTMPECG